MDGCEEGEVWWRDETGCMASRVFGSVDVDCRNPPLNSALLSSWTSLALDSASTAALVIESICFECFMPVGSVHKRSSPSSRCQSRYFLLVCLLFSFISFIFTYLAIRWTKLTFLSWCSFTKSSQNVCFHNEKINYKSPPFLNF